MSVPNLDKEVQKALTDLEKIFSRVLPVKVGKGVVSSVRQNFRSGGFYGQRWQTTKRQQVPFKGAEGGYSPLLSRTTHLMSSTDYVPGNAQVTIRNTAPYAKYHNEGASSRVTKKMKKFFWAKHYEAGSGRKKGKRPSPEADFWKAMALKKPGSKIKIPKRRFLGPSPKVDEIVRKTIITWHNSGLFLINSSNSGSNRCAETLTATYLQFYLQKLCILGYLYRLYAP